MASLLTYKIVVTMLAVLGLSFVAEKISARLAGLLAGYPIGTAIILHFYGLEYGAGFAADAAVFNLCGLLASQCLAYVYCRAAARRMSLAATSLLALGGYLLPALVLSQARPTPLTALAVAVAATALFCLLLRGRTGRPAAVLCAWSPGLVAGRLLFTAALVLAVTGIADRVGPAWAGLFSAFPVALYPLVFLLHREHGPEIVQDLLARFPFGLWSVIAYSLVVSRAYPVAGVAWGTLLGFAAATIVLAAMGMKPLLARRRAAAHTAG